MSWRMDKGKICDECLENNVTIKFCDRCGFDYCKKHDTNHLTLSCLPKEMRSVTDHIAKLKKEIEERTKEVERIEKLHQKYPDLKKCTGRWDKVSFYSKTVNHLANDVVIRHNCGCCNDSPIEVWCYYNDPEVGRVGTEPAYFCVGDKNPSGGERPDNDWERQIRDAKVSEEVIVKIREFFQNNPPIEDDIDDKMEE